MVPFVVLIILDGWGIGNENNSNAIFSANTPNFDKYWSAYPHTKLLASGEAVGLPKGEAGNTETGHLNIGAGRIVYQDLLRINMAIQDGAFYKNETFINAINHAKKYNSNLHLMGLLGAGGVHANTSHLFALLEICRQQDFDRVFLHLFTDGRDSPPTSAEHYIKEIEKNLNEYGRGKIATVMGRYWAMDRDLRWDRTEVAYNALVNGIGKHVESITKAINDSYKSGINDEFINPIIVSENGNPITQIKENDSAIFYNFRIDRPRQLTRAFVIDDFVHEGQKNFDFDPYAVKYTKSHLSQTISTETFKRGEKLKNLFFVTMTEYDRTLNNLVHIAFPQNQINQNLGEIISTYEKRQLRISESEKERFVTFYFDGQRELRYWGEDVKIVPSKKVKTYDLAPEMSAQGITNTFFENATGPNSGKYPLVVINFANADMVGHTGNFEATVKACEVIDSCLGQIVTKVSLLGGVTLITADHGNAECMLTENGSVNTEHTANPVPFIAIGDIFMGEQTSLQTGVLGDIAPTILKLLEIRKPEDMTGKSLI